MASLWDSWDTWDSRVSSVELWRRSTIPGHGKLGTLRAGFRASVPTVSKCPQDKGQIAPCLSRRDARNRGPTVPTVPLVRASGPRHPRVALFLVRPLLIAVRQLRNLVGGRQGCPGHQGASARFFAADRDSGFGNYAEILVNP